MPGPTGSQFRPLSRLRKRPARTVPQYTRAGSRGSTATQSGDRPPKCSSTVQVEARRAIKRAARVTTTMPTMTQSPSVCGSVLYDSSGIRVDDVEPAFFAFDLCEKLVQVIEIRGVGFDRRDVAPHKLRGGIQLGLSPTGNEDVRSFL